MSGADWDVQRVKIAMIVIQGLDRTLWLGHEQLELDLQSCRTNRQQGQMSLRKEQMLSTDVPGNVRTSSIGNCSCYGSATGWYTEGVILKVTLSLCTPCRLAGNGGTSPLIPNFSAVQRSVLPAIPLHPACRHIRFLLNWNWLDRL
jgi:hypothetical protein